MSSTNRKGTERVAHDFYVTPQDHVELFLNEFSKIDPAFPSHMRSGKVLDPSAGGMTKAGKLFVGLDKQGNRKYLKYGVTPMTYPEAIRNVFEVEIDTFDLRKNSFAETKGNFLTHDFDKNYNVVITNPPFGIIQEFINKAYDITQDGAYIIMLCRLNFFGSKKRFNFFKNRKPTYSIVHHERMGFTPNGKKDSIEYCHNVWIKGNNPDHTKLIVI